MGICHSSIGGITMIHNYDGVYLNEPNISVVEPSQILSPNGDHFVIKFIVFQECYIGKTKFETEKECRAKIDQLFGCEKDLTNRKITLTKFSDYSKDVKNLYQISDDMYRIEGTKPREEWEYDDEETPI